MEGPASPKRALPNPTESPDSVSPPGGTIASRIDYRTGAVTPALDAAELSDSVPELARIANMHPRRAALRVLGEHNAGPLAADGH